MVTSSKVQEDGRRVPYSEVENTLPQQLIAALRAGKTHSAIDLRPDVEHGGDVALFRGHSSIPCFGGGPTEDRERPPGVLHLKRKRGSSSLVSAFLAIGVYFAVGALAFFKLGNLAFGVRATSIIDALYFCAVTLTTTGYGDMVPETSTGKLFTCVYLLVGFCLVLTLVSRAAGNVIEKQEQIIVRAIKKKSRQVFEQPEVDHAKAVSWKAFIAGLQLVFLLVMGQTCLMLVEGLSFVDALYCVCVTITTLGYGDFSFHTQTGRLFAVIWILASTVSLAQFLLFLAEMKTLRRQLELAEYVLHRKPREADLYAADLNRDGTVSASEFLIFKLEELGKINEEDIVGILREFKSLDCDRSGFITLGDLSQLRYRSLR